MFNLVNVLSAEDKQKITNYIKRFGVHQGFIGADEWLKYWGESKIKLYKLLGNNFIYKIPFKYEKNEWEFEKQIIQLQSKNEFLKEFHKWVQSYIHHNLSFEKKENIQLRNFLYDIESCHTLMSNRISAELKYEKPEHKKLQFQRDAKPLRVIKRLMDYFKDDIGEDLYQKMCLDFEEFRLEHSRILNDKILKGELVFSIHPLDFLTMSDNKEWSSCMSWRNEGCYRAGTIEMMNSNNVICCYLETTEKFDFCPFKEKVDTTKKCRDNYQWNNKRWRTLAYVTKDIIVNGKSYPYNNKSLNEAVITTLRKLAKENLGWEYKFGPEPYKDMQYINGNYSMDRAKDYIHLKDMKKHNILFDTKGMYNDMLNDNRDLYSCVRNKVKHNKIISYSGKCNCVKCNKTIITYKNDFDFCYDEPLTSADYYNGRYSNVSNVVCSDCLDSFCCDDCGQVEPTTPLYKYKNFNGEVVKLCFDCWKNMVKVCPCCGKPMLIRHISWGLPHFLAPLKQNIPSTATIEQQVRTYKKIKSPYDTKVRQNDRIAPVFGHFDCLKEKFGFERMEIVTNYNSVVYETYILPKQEYEYYLPFYYDNLSSAAINKEESLILDSYHIPLAEKSIEKETV